MDGLKGFFSGSAPLMIALFMMGMAAGGWLGGVWNDATAGHEYKRIATQSSDALVTLVQNAGRREMNYLYRAEADRAQCTEAISTFRQWEQLSADAKLVQSKRTAELEARLKALSDQYANLVKSYENADKTTTGWLNSGVPLDLCIVRYGSACRADPFAAAGYPDPPARPGPVADPPGR